MATDVVLDALESAWDSVREAFWAVWDWFGDGFGSLRGLAKMVSVAAVAVVVAVVLLSSTSDDGASPMPQPAPVVRSPVPSQPGVPIPGPTGADDT
jgi:hypothetical protein